MRWFGNTGSTELGTESQQVGTHLTALVRMKGTIAAREAVAPVMES